MRKLWIAAACLVCATANGLASAPGNGKAKARKRKTSAHSHRETPLHAAAVNDASLAETVGPGASANAILRAQVLLAREHFSCGEIDGRYGTNLERAISDYQAARGLPETGKVDAETWRALDGESAPALVRVQVAPEDVAGPFEQVPEEMMEKSKLAALNYSSPLEGIAEKYHSSPALLKKLNPGASFDRAGEEVVVPNVQVPPPEKAASVSVSRSRRTVAARDASGRILARYPATIGSEHDPLPLGKWKVLGVAKNPPFHYNPNLFWDAKENDGKARIAPGPNNPVGVAWIDLDKEHYGIHGSPEPSQIGKTQSHGCIRLTNWDVTELAAIVGPGTPAILEE